jgi:hypothetical protein
LHWYWNCNWSQRSWGITHTLILQVFLNLVSNEESYICSNPQ